jgi:hypothetical protein
VSVNEKAAPGASSGQAGRPSTTASTQSAVDRLRDRLSRSIVCRQKPQKENSAGNFGCSWGKIQPLLKGLKAGAGLID